MTIQKIIEISKKISIEKDVECDFYVDEKILNVRFYKFNNGIKHNIGTSFDFDNKLQYKSNKQYKDFIEFLVNKLLMDCEGLKCQ